MTDGDDAREGRSNAATPDAATQRRRRLLAMGGVLGEVTGDESDQGWGDGAPGSADRAADAGLRREVPPHHSG